MTLANHPYLILVGIDYSPTSEQALEHAIGIAAVTPNAELHVVHVATAFEPSPLEEDASALTLDTTQALEQLKTYVAVSLGAFEKKSGGTARGPLRVVSHLLVHAPGHKIAQLASDLQADLVVVGMHGRGGFSRFFLGSAAETVARLAPCPVLVFRPKGVTPEYPKIEPPCPQCVIARVASEGQEYWCDQHRQRHGRRHVYYQTELMSQSTNFPLISTSAASNV